MSELEKEMFEAGYRNIKRLSTGELAGTMRQMFTVGLFVGLTETGYKRRFCYELETDADRALRQWDGTGDPPGPWVKEKPSDRLGPGATMNQSK